MSPSFQKTLNGSGYTDNSDLKKSNIVKKFVELNMEMYLSNQRLTATHPYGSQWYTWPFMVRPIYYWVKDDARIYLLGNPVIWWASAVAILFGLLQITQRLAQRVFKKSLAIGDWRLAILSGGFLLNILPFIGISRVMFLYHYLPGLILAIITLVYLIDQSKQKKKIFFALIALAAVSFVYFAPLTYGLKQSPEQYRQHLWLKTWE